VQCAMLDRQRTGARKIHCYTSVRDSEGAENHWPRG